MKIVNKIFRRKCDNCGSRSHLKPIQTGSEGIFNDEGLFLCEPCLADFSEPDLDYLYRALTPKRPALKHDYKDSLK